MRSRACFRESCARRRAAALRCARVLPIMELLPCRFVEGLCVFGRRRVADVVPADPDPEPVAPRGGGPDSVGVTSPVARGAFGLRQRSIHSPPTKTCTGVESCASITGDGAHMAAGRIVAP